MRNLIALLAIIIIGNMLSCTVETSDNGKLDGFWHLVSIDSVASGKTMDTENDYYFWAFQYKLLSVRNTRTGSEYFLRFSHEGDSLLLSEPYMFISQGVDSLLPSADSLREYGINSLEERFKVVSLSSQRMELRSRMLQLKFKKF